MPKIPDFVLHPIQAALEQWDDERVISASSLEDLLLFDCSLPSILSQSKLTLCGVVCRQKQEQYLMTVKVRQGETPLVVFITAGSTTGCRSRFLRLWEEDRLTWVKDRYPWI